MGARFGGRVFVFPGAEVEVSPDGRRVETRWPDGVTLVAVPHETAEYAARARALGYSGGDPAWEMCWQHEIAHHWLSWQFNHESSRVLRAVAEGREADPDLYGAEEDLVLAWQRFVTADEKTGPLRWLVWHDWDLDQERAWWRRFVAEAPVAALLAGETG
jgi:hypothetical protein